MLKHNETRKINYSVKKAMWSFNISMKIFFLSLKELEQFTKGI